MFVEHRRVVVGEGGSLSRGLLADGHLVLLGVSMRGRDRVGRVAVALTPRGRGDRFRGAMDTVLALDVGGTKMAAAVVDADGARARPRAPAPRRAAPGRRARCSAALLGVAARGAHAAAEVAVRRRVRADR